MPINPKLYQQQTIGQSPYQQAAQNSNSAWAAQNSINAQNMTYNALLAQGGGNYGTVNQVNGSMKRQDNYMIDGVRMDFNTFINTLYPDDCAEKTFLILKLKKDDK